MQLRSLAKVLMLVCVGLLLLSDIGRAQDSIKAFRYQPRKIEVGIVYHYLKTNIDGTNPEHISIYVASNDQIESFKFHPKGTRAALVIATMDWSTFSAKNLESWQVHADKEKALVATLRYLPAGREVEVAIPIMNKGPEQVTIKYLPFHVYNFDLASLNFAFRHLVDPAKPFKVGISDPTFSDSGPAFSYRGEVEIAFLGEEVRAGELCRKYRIDGPGLQNRGGTIWVNKRGGHFQDLEIALPDNPDWQSFKFKLQKTERMNRLQWAQFQKAQF